MSRSADNEVVYSFDGPKHQPVDMNALNAAIEAEVGGPSQEPAPAIAPDATSRPAAATPIEAAPAEPAPAPTASPEDPARTFKITVDGQELEVTEADLKSGHMRHRDYTQKTQRIAERERQLASQEKTYQDQLAAQKAELDQIDQFLKNEDAIRAYMQRAFRAQAAAAVPPVIDPNKPLTVNEVAEIARFNAEQVRAASQREMDDFRRQQHQELQRQQDSLKQQERERAEHRVISHIDTLVAKHPVLKKFDGIQEELMADASRFQPRSVEEAIQRLSEAAERKITTIRSIAAEEQKAAAVKAAQLKQTSPEPPGGQPVRQAPGKKLSMDPKDRKARLEAAEADVRAILGQG